MTPKRSVGLALVSMVLTAACTSSSTHPSTPSSVTSGGTPSSSSSVSAVAAAQVPRWDHVVIVVMENHSYSDVIGSSSAPYLTSLSAHGASFTQSYAISHPSEPNYLALFSGSTQQLTDDSCPHTFQGSNLGYQLRAAGDSFAGYSESLPRTGYVGCVAGSYARKHNPWVNFTNLPASVNRRFTAFPSDYTTLPTVSYVIPNLNHDMHDGSVAQGDEWVRANLDGYARWASAHRSLLIVTWDEDDQSAQNHVPTIAYGANVKQGKYRQKVTHYSWLRTLETAYGLSALGGAASAALITSAWTVPK